MASPENRTGENETDEWEIPDNFGHSGKLDEHMREGHPTKEFDDSKLDDPVDEGLLTTPGDPGTLPESVQEDYDRPAAELGPDHPESTPPAEPQTAEHTPPRNIISRKFIALAGGAMLAGGAFLAALTGGGEDDSSNNAPEVVTEEEAADTVPTTAPIEVDETPVEELPEELTPEVQYFSVDDPEELVAITEHNMNCLLNAVEYGDGLRCIDYIVGGGSGEIANSLQEALTEVWNYRQDNPDFILSNTYEVIDSSTEGVGEIEVIVKQTLANGEESYHHWKYTVGYLRTEDLSVDDDQSTQIWKLSYRKPVEPGEVYFG